MNKNDRMAFAEILTGLGEIYDKKISKIIIEIYWDALKEYPLDDVKRATNNIVRTHKYATLPKPAEFIEFINPVLDIEIKAEFAMDEFWEHFNDSGHDSFEWRDPILAMTVKHYGGWGMVLAMVPCSDLKEQTFWIKDFKKTYCMFVRFPRERVQLKYIGLFESDNTAKGYLADKLGHPIALSTGDGYVKIGSPEAQKLLDDRAVKQLITSVSNRNA